MDLTVFLSQSKPFHWFVKKKKNTLTVADYLSKVAVVHIDFLNEKRQPELFHVTVLGQGLSVCPKMATLTETSGVLTSPYQPRRYPSNEKCSWKIIASKGERILLFIEDIDIRTCGSSCTCDYLEIQNGLSSDGISGRRRCRSDKDSGIVYHSAKDVLRVTFVSGARTYNWWYRGFKATYIKVKYNATTTGKSLEIGF